MRLPLNETEGDVGLNAVERELDATRVSSRGTRGKRRFLSVTLAFESAVNVEVGTFAGPMIRSEELGSTKACEAGDDGWPLKTKGTRS